MSELQLKVCRRASLASLLGVCWLTATLAGAPIDVLQIGASPKILAESADQETSAREALLPFVKEETGLASALHFEPGYRELAAKLDKGQLQVGIFYGYEFAWALERYPKLKPLAVAVNAYPNRYVHVVARRNHPAGGLADLGGQSLALPRAGQGYLRLFVERASLAQGQEPKDFLANLVETDSSETALDDVVDGLVQAAAVDRVALRAYQRRKPGRFAQLKEVAGSPALPAPVVAYRPGQLDEPTQKRFQEGLIHAERKPEGQRLLMAARLTGFALPPKDFDRQLAETRKRYPPPGQE